MPEIEAFAEVGEYFDQPVRTYSSGMQMRVAFSVATAFRPDLLIVDEALSVGDNYFQHKSFDRIRQFKADGVSIMFVTHSMADIRTLCDRVILLDQGRVLKDGQPDEIVDYYNALIAAKENAKLSVDQKREKNGWLVTKSGTGEARITSLQLLDAISGNVLAAAQVGQSVALRLEVAIHADIPKLVLGYMIRDKQGHVVWGTNTWHTQQIQDGIKAGETLVFNLPFTCTLGPGSYSVSPALVSSDTHLSDNYEWVDNLLVFDVLNVDRQFFIGSNYLDAQFSISRQRTGCSE
jgi:lipopolysaccharide transport system ATP-binding protein